VGKVAETLRDWWVSPLEDWGEGNEQTGRFTTGQKTSGRQIPKHRLKSKPYVLRSSNSQREPRKGGAGMANPGKRGDDKSATGWAPHGGGAEDQKEGEKGHPGNGGLHWRVGDGQGEKSSVYRGVNFQCQEGTETNSHRVGGEQDWWDWGGGRNETEGASGGDLEKRLTLVNTNQKSKEQKSGGGGAWWTKFSKNGLRKSNKKKKERKTRP